jgi:hypothetical protein
MAKVPSPDDSWAALMQEEACSDGAFVTTVEDYIRLVRRSEAPTCDNDVFAIEYHGGAKYRPVLEWLSSRKLRITVPNKCIVDLQKSSYQGIDVSVRFEPDEPAERERFLKSLGRDTK